jgi:hypothetical protein
MVLSAPQVGLSKAEFWKTSAQMIAVVAALSYWGYVSQLHNLRSVCNNLWNALGTEEGAYYPNSELGFTDSQMQRLIERSPHLGFAISQCLAKAGPVSLGYDD